MSAESYPEVMAAEALTGTLRLWSARLAVFAVYALGLTLTGLAAGLTGQMVFAAVGIGAASVWGVARRLRRNVAEAAADGTGS